MKFTSAKFLMIHVPFFNIFDNNMDSFLFFVLLEKRKNAFFHK